MKALAAILFLTAMAVRAEDAPVIARSGGIELRADEVRELIAGIEADQADSAAKDSATKDPAALGQYVRALLVQRLVLQQALAGKWDQEPAVIARLVRARESALTESFLQNASRPEPGYPDDAELAGAYETAKPKLLVPRTFQLAQIYIAADKAKLDATLRQLKARGADFAAIARATSEESASAAKGGLIGWLTEEQIQPGIRERLPKLTLGAVSEAIRLKDGWHILKVLDIREAHTPTLDQIRGQLAARLRAERAQAKRREYLAKLLQDNPVAINEIELFKVQSPVGQPGN